MKCFSRVLPLLACAGMLAVGGVGLSGCLDSQAHATVGEETADSASFLLSNDLGKTVTAIEVKASSAKKFGSPLAQGAPIPAGETVEISYAPVSDESDVCIRTDDGTRYVLHAINLADVENVQLRADGQIAYLDYDSTKLAQHESTLQHEKDLVKASEAEKTGAKKKTAKEKKKRGSAAKAESSARATDDGNSGSSTSSSKRGHSSGSSKSTSKKPSAKGSSSGASKETQKTKKKEHSSSSKHAGSSAAEKAAKDNGSSQEQKCTKDF